MKVPALILIYFSALLPGFSQYDTDSLTIELSRAATSDFLFKAFTNSHRRIVYSRPEIARVLYRKIETLALKKGLPEEAATAMDIQGIYYQNTGAFDSAKLKYTEALKLRKKMHKPILLARSFNNLGVLHRKKGEYDSALLYYHWSLNIAEEVKDSTLIGDYLSNIGLVYQNQQDHEKAIRYNLKSLSIRRQIRDTLKTAASYNNLGIIYIDIKDYREAGEYLNESLKIKRKIGEKKPIANTLTNLGIVHYHLQDYERAMVKFEEALDMYESLQDRQGAAATLENLAFLAKKAEDLPRAYDYSKQALEIRKELKHPGDMISSYVNTAAILIDNERKTEAAALLDTAYALAGQLREPAPLKEVAQAKALLYETTGDYRRAYRFYREFAALKDSLLNERNLDRIAELREQYETAQKEQQLQLNEAELSRHEALIARQSLQRNFVAAFAAAILAILLLVFFSYRARLRAREAINQKTVEMEGMRSHFFANISHEFRTPLTLIQSTTDELIEKSTHPNMLRIVKSNAHRLLRLVDQLLDLSRADAGKLRLSVQKGDISQLIRAIGGSFASMATQMNIRYVVGVDDGIHGYCDADKLEKILVNLLSNAFKFTPEEGVVTLKAQKKASQLELTVDDTGPGISKEERKMVFDRFYQNAKKRHQGAGIGLALVKELVNLQGGAIEVESDKAYGTQFRIMLPLSLNHFQRHGALVLRDALGEYASTPQHDMTRSNDGDQIWIKGSKPSVLIVEDNVDLRRHIKSILFEKFEVAEATNGKEGLETAERIMPDMIVSDIMMPVMDGIRLCEKLKTSVITSHIPLILLTARASEDDKLEGLRTGADDYLIKPFSKRELLARIENLLQQREKLIAKFSQSLNPREVNLTSADEEFIKRARAIIECHLDDSSFTVQHLSVEIGMSRTQLFRKLQALTGVSASEFIRLIRLNRAAEMLKNKTATVSEIAYGVGFNNLSYFTKRFKQRFGVTPGNYR